MRAQVGRKADRTPTAVIFNPVFGSINPAILFALAAIILLPPAASAFELEKTAGGIPLMWQSLPVPFSINRVCSGPDTSKESCYGAVKAGFDTWAGPECTYFSFSEPDITDSTESGDDGKNLVVWRTTGWTYGSSVLALTTILFDDRTGTMVDADIEVNGHDWSWRVLTSTSSKYIDIQTVIVHESGHVVGLDHSPVQQAVMYYMSKAGSIKRDLAQDDIDGVCTQYPQPEPKPDEGGGGCSVAGLGL